MDLFLFCWDKMIFVINKNNEIYYVFLFNIPFKFSNINGLGVKEKWVMCPKFKNTMFH